MSTKQNHKLRPSETRYSEDIPGDAGNYEWSVRFDVNGRGYLGIDQAKEEKDGGRERVLLSPKQVAALLKFLAKE